MFTTEAVKIEWKKMVSIMNELRKPKSKFKRYHDEEIISWLPTWNIL